MLGNRSEQINQLLVNAKHAAGGGQRAYYAVSQLLERVGAFSAQLKASSTTTRTSTRCSRS